MLSYIEISKQNLLDNFQAFRNFVHPDTKIVAVIKANAYGHDQNIVAKLLEPVTDYFQVDDAQEFNLLRQITNKSTLILGYVAKDELKEVIANGGIMGVYDLDQINAINQEAQMLGKKAVVHVKIDADLGRQGVLLEKLVDFSKELKRCEHILVDGIYTHFANIEDTSDFSHAQKQIDAFGQAVAIMEKEGFTNLNKHLSASSGVMVWEKNTGVSELVRPGIGLYGMWPSDELKRRFENDQFKLKPVLRWVTHVAQIKTVKENYSIGYGLTYVTKKPTKIAVIPQGYSDGYDRGFSNVGQVLIHGRRCPVLGRIAMNMFVVDVTDLDEVRVEDEVVLLGTQGNDCITAEELAMQLGTINYEITTRISPLLKRVIVD